MIGRVQDELFGRFPRSVGNPRQFWSFDRESFRFFLEKNEGENNVYASISHFGQSGVPVTDKVSFDLDTPVKDVAFPDTKAEDMKIMEMREESGKAHEVLNTVCDDAEKVARYCIDEDIPVIGVFTGFGIHVHLLYQDSRNPEEELTSTVHYLIDELDLKTVDRKPIGDTSRLLRVPNCRRIYDTRSCSLWTIPVTVDELIEWSPEDFVHLSGEPRQIPLPDRDRPEMQVYDEHFKSEEESDTTRRPLEGNWDGIGDDDIWVRWHLKEVLKMPCMYQRLLQRDPGHFVRLNSAVRLFQEGHSVDEVISLFRALDWNDWNEKITRQQLNQIYKKGYVDMSCETVQKYDLCVFGEDNMMADCDTYGWSGGNEYRDI